MNRKTPMLPEDDVRETPPEAFDPLNAMFAFTLDACATHRNAKCSRYCTETGTYSKHPDGAALLLAREDGLTASWRGERVFVNPPFSAIRSWVAKAHGEVDADLICMLVPATRTEQSWWHEYVEPNRDSFEMYGDDPIESRLKVRFLRGRTKFWKDGEPIKGSPKFGCCLLIWR